MSRVRIEIEKIITRLIGTSGADDSCVMEEFDITLEQLEEIMLEANYERCSECEWWCECCELVDQNNEQICCNSCNRN